MMANVHTAREADFGTSATIAGGRWGQQQQWQGRSKRTEEAGAWVAVGALGSTIGADGSSMTSGEGDVDGTDDRRADVGSEDNCSEDGEKMQQGDSGRRGMAAQLRSLTA
ncbi:hypothetical protein BHE74_00030808 [Ensete ventricosum]|nr:hypothetical protein BHE74_00030808 [Ensete ventricosum]